MQLKLQLWWYVRRSPAALDSEDRTKVNLIAGDANQGESRSSRGSREYISPKEVAQHCLSQDAWIIINGRVYE
jgi:cytochrome b involved in lipid metabolism